MTPRYLVAAAVVGIIITVTVGAYVIEPLRSSGCQRAGGAALPGASAPSARYVKIAVIPHAAPAGATAAAAATATEATRIAMGFAVPLDPNAASGPSPCRRSCRSNCVRGSLGSCSPSRSSGRKRGARRTRLRLRLQLLLLLLVQEQRGAQARVLYLEVARSARALRLRPRLSGQLRL